MIFTGSSLNPFFKQKLEGSKGHLLSPPWSHPIQLHLKSSGLKLWTGLSNPGGASTAILAPARRHPRPLQKGTARTL